MYNRNGLKYFLQVTTRNSRNYLELPEEIRKIIWYYAHNYPYLSCYICNKLLLNFETNINDINEINIVENYSIINGTIKCNSCYLD